MINLNFTLFIQLINFLVLLFVLNAILYKPVIAKIREREARIKRDQEQALELEQTVLAQENQHQQELANARQTASQEKSGLLAEAKKTEADVLAKARTEAAKIVDEMKSAIQADADEARKVLRAQMTPLVESIAEKILGRKVA